MDLISRQAAIDALREIEFSHYMEFGEYIGEDIREVRLIRAEKAQDTIEQLPSAQPEPKWIPCSERLPDKTDDYLCSYNGCALVDICEYDADRNEWGFFYDGDWKKVSNVIAWMPLPEPYAERRTDGHEREN